MSWVRFLAAIGFGIWGIIDGQIGLGLSIVIALAPASVFLFLPPLLMKLDRGDYAQIANTELEN